MEHTMRTRKTLAGLMVVVILSGVVTAAFANDTAVAGIGGRWHPMKGEHPRIRMKSERIRIDVREGYNRAEKSNSYYYTADVDFVFENSGGATSVQMGFPEGAGGAADLSTFRRKPTFLEFSTWVDGRKTAAKRVVASVSEDEEDAQAYWVKTVTFARHQTRRVRVHYKAWAGGFADKFANFVPYDFTGGNWRGNVAQSTLEVTLNVPGKREVRAGFEGSEKQILKIPSRHSGKTYTYIWRNWQAQNYFRFSFTNPLKTTAAKLNGARPYLDVYPFPRALTEADLKGKSASDLQVMRNAIYARHGRSFKDAKLAAYFGKQSWYHADSKWRDGVSDKKLSDLERRNAGFIRNHEPR
jgi:hypothetical protein